MAKYVKSWIHDTQIDCAQLVSVVLQTVGAHKTKQKFKDSILNTCDHMNNEWGNQVRLRILASVSDLHVADAQYHRDCLQSSLLSAASFC